MNTYQTLDGHFYFKTGIQNNIVNSIPVDDTEHSIIIDYDESNRIVGVEILGFCPQNVSIKNCLDIIIVSFSDIPVNAVVSIQKFNSIGFSVIYHEGHVFGDVDVLHSFYIFKQKYSKIF